MREQTYSQNTNHNSFTSQNKESRITLKYPHLILSSVLPGIVRHGRMNWSKLQYHMTQEAASDRNFPGSYPCDLEAHRLRRPETSHYGLALSLLMRQLCTYLTGNPSPSTPWSWTSGPEAFFGAIGVVSSTPEVLYYLILSTVTFARPGI